MNRLKTAQRVEKTQATSGSNCWGQEYTYDRYANLTAMAIAATHGSCTGQTVLNLGISPTTNRITDSGVSYDAAGNLLSEGFSSYTWTRKGVWHRRRRRELRTTRRQIVRNTLGGPELPRATKRLSST